MFARKVAVRLKPGALDEFTHFMEREILPWLRMQEGFLDLITLAVPDRSEVAIITFWGYEMNAQVYSACGYPQCLEMLGHLFDGIPYVKTFEVVGSTLQTLAPRNGANITGTQDQCLTTFSEEGRVAEPAAQQQMRA